MFEISMGVVIAATIFYLVAVIWLVESRDDLNRQFGLGMLVAPSVMSGLIVIVGLLKTNPSCVRSGMLGLGGFFLVALFVLAIDRAFFMHRRR